MRPVPARRRAAGRGPAPECGTPATGGARAFLRGSGGGRGGRLPVDQPIRPICSSFSSTVWAQLSTSVPSVSSFSSGFSGAS